MSMKEKHGLLSVNILKKLRGEDYIEKQPFPFLFALPFICHCTIFCYQKWSQLRNFNTHKKVQYNVL